MMEFKNVGYDFDYDVLLVSVEASNSVYSKLSNISIGSNQSIYNLFQLLLDKEQALVGDNLFDILETSLKEYDTDNDLEDEDIFNIIDYAVKPYLPEIPHTELETVVDATWVLTPKSTNEKISKACIEENHVEQSKDYMSDPKSKAKFFEPIYELSRRLRSYKNE